MNKGQRSRTRLILIGIVIAACILGGGLYRIQIIQGSLYAARAHKQYTQPSGGSFDRGKIYFNSKYAVPVASATIATGYTVYMNPKLIADPTGTFQALAQFITIPESLFL